MSPLRIAFSEILFRWRSALMMVLMVALITGTVSYYWTNQSGFTREIKRNVRDIGSNIVILPAQVDQQEYQESGGYSSETMPVEVVQQLIQFKASLNHLIPMLEQRQPVTYDGKSESARIVGISASIPMPGRPKAPMQKAVPKDKVQVGFALADRLGLKTTDDEQLQINGRKLTISRINRPTGTWQDSSIFLDLESAQKLFDQPGRISRIEAIECTSEKCVELGLSSDVVLKNELANITDQAQLLRRQSMADARAKLRNMSAKNLQLLSNIMWLLLVTSVTILATWNVTQRRSEIGLFRAIGFGQFRIVRILTWRAFFLSLLGGTIGIVGGALLAVQFGLGIFDETGTKMSIDLNQIIWLLLLTVTLTILASSIPVLFAASRDPAALVGKEAN